MMNVSNYRHEMMLSCWSPDASDRPNFQPLAESLEALLERESGYLKLAESLKLKGEKIPSPKCPEVIELQSEIEVVNENTVDA